VWAQAWREYCGPRLVYPGLGHGKLTGACLGRSWPASLRGQGKAGSEKHRQS